MAYYSRMIRKITGKPVEQLFARFGGGAKLARATNAPKTTVQSWKESGIPMWRLPSIREAAKAENIDLPAAFRDVA